MLPQVCQLCASFGRHKPHDCRLVREACEELTARCASARDNLAGQLRELEAFVERLVAVNRDVQSVCFLNAAMRWVLVFISLRVRRVDVQPCLSSPGCLTLWSKRHMSADMRSRRHLRITCKCHWLHADCDSAFAGG